MRVDRVRQPAGTRARASPKSSVRIRQALRRFRASVARSSTRWADTEIHTAMWSHAGHTDQTGARGALVVRGVAAYSAAVAHACLDASAYVSLTVANGPQGQSRDRGDCRRRLEADQYPNAVWDDASVQWVSEAEIAETRYTAFTSKPGGATTARLIVRRVKDRNTRATQDDLFPIWRYHAVFTNSPLVLVQAEAQHRDTPPSNRSWPTCSTGRWRTPVGEVRRQRRLACAGRDRLQPFRASACLASAFHARARGATLRRHLIWLSGVVHREHATSLEMSTQRTETPQGRATRRRAGRAAATSGKAAVSEFARRLLTFTAPDSSTTSRAPGSRPVSAPTRSPHSPPVGDRRCGQASAPPSRARSSRLPRPHPSRVLPGQPCRRRVKTDPAWHTNFDPSVR